MITFAKSLSILLVLAGAAGFLLGFAALALPLLPVDEAAALGSMIGFARSLPLLGGALGLLVVGPALYLLALLVEQQVAIRELMEDDWDERHPPDDEDERIIRPD